MLVICTGHVVWPVTGEYCESYDHCQLETPVHSYMNRFYSKDANIGDHKPASFTIELRDTGGDGFLLSPDKVSGIYSSFCSDYEEAYSYLLPSLFSQIIATSKEAMTAIMVLANKVLINPLM